MFKRFYIAGIMVFFIVTSIFAGNYSNQAILVKQKFENFLKPRGINVSIVLDKDIPDKNVKKKFKNFRLVSLKLYKGKRQQILTFLTDGNLIIRDLEIAGKPLNLIEEYQSQLMKYHVKISEDEIISGKPDAKVKVVVFGDFQCPFCRRAMSFILQNYKNNPDVAIYFKQFPLPFHKYAKTMAKVFIAAKMTGVNLIDLMETYNPPNNKKVEEVEKDLVEKAKAKIPENKRGLFLQFLKDKSIMKKISENEKEGRELGVTGTPTIFINGKKVVGLKPQLIKKFIDEALKNGKN